ncbi:MAG: SpoIID/LytB domain-containing protein [Planctomycetota bacterium]|jgi:stage II sporulation protein D
MAGLGLTATALAAVRCGSESPSRPLAIDRTAPSGPAPRRRPPLPTAEPLMRVRIFRARGKERRISVGESGQRLAVVATDEGTRELRAPVRVTLAADGWTIVDDRGERLAVAGLRPFELERRAGKEPFLKVGSRSYPGALRLVARHDLEPGAFDVVNLVMMEDYLPGVVTGELYDHWKLQTRAAQAVAARSFAASEHANFQGRRAYDVNNTAASQVYLGRVRHRDSIKAVELTRGVVLASGGLLVPGYYSACCGGLAANAVDAIGPHPANDTVPLRGRSGTDVCAEKKVANWTVVRSAKDLLPRLRAYGQRLRRDDLSALGSLVAVEVAETNEHGRPTGYAIRGAAGERIELTAPAFRSACNYSGAGLGAPEKTLWSSHVDVSISGDEVRIDGHGYGHGVGLCQYGAEALARSGSGHEEILEWYYPGAEIVQVY